MPDPIPGEDAGHTSGIHGPDCSCTGGLTVPRWLSLHMSRARDEAEAHRDAASYAEVTGAAVHDGVLPSILLYTIHTLIAVNGRGWVPEDEDCRIIDDPDCLTGYRVEVATAFITLQRLFELANDSLRWPPEVSAKAYEEALSLIENLDVDGIWWLSVLVCDMGAIAVHTMDEVERFVWMTTADRPFDDDARPVLPGPHVTMAMARIGGALAVKNEKRFQHWWSFYGDMGIQKDILDAMLLEMATGTRPGEMPSLVAMDSDGMLQGILDPAADVDAAAEASGIAADEVRAMLLVARGVIRMGNGEPYSMDHLHEDAGDLIHVAAVSLLRSYGFQVGQEWVRATTPDDGQPV